MDIREKTKIVVVDDSAVFRQGLIDFLRGYGDMEVVGEACDGETAVRKVGELTPDVVMMDVRMPVMNGLVALRALKALKSPPKVFILTAFDSIEYREAAKAAGADAYMAKASITEELIPAIRMKRRQYQRNEKNRKEVYRA